MNAVILQQNTRKSVDSVHHEQIYANRLQRHSEHIRFRKNFKNLPPPRRRRAENRLVFFLFFVFARRNRPALLLLIDKEPYFFNSTPHRKRRDRRNNYIHGPVEFYVSRG